MSVTAPVLFTTRTDVLKHRSSQRIVRHKLIYSQVDALRLQRRLFLQRRVCARCKEGEATPYKGHPKEDNTPSIGFSVNASLDEWGTHDEPDRPTSTLPTVLRIFRMGHQASILISRV